MKSLCKKEIPGNERIAFNHYTSYDYLLIYAHLSFKVLGVQSIVKNFARKLRTQDFVES